MVIPTDYITGYEKARAIDEEMASRYLAHTHIGDPLGDEAAVDLANLSRAKSMKFIALGMDDSNSLEFKRAPASMQALFKDAEREPEWLDFRKHEPGVRMFHRNSYIVLVAFVAGVLIEGFTSNIAKSFMLTGRVRDSGIRRLGQNNRHMTEMFFPGGMLRHGDGWKLSFRIRIIHAQMRRLLNESEEWDAEAWGTPLSAAHMGFAISAFSARLLEHMKTLGATYTDEERESFMEIWRYSGYLMGIPDTILFRDAQEALKIFETGLACEPKTGIESTVMAHALIESAPLMAGATTSEERDKLAKYVYRMSQSLIGKEMAESLQYPEVSTFGVAWWFRTKNRADRLLGRVIPGHTGRSSFRRFGYLLDASTFDKEGISYQLPDHVYAEESSQW